MFCTNCGSQLPEGGAKFCPNCGVRVAEPLTPDYDVASEVEPAPATEAEPAAIETPEPDTGAAVLSEEAAAPYAEEEPVIPEPEIPVEDTACPNREQVPVQESEPEPICEPSFTPPPVASPVTSEKPKRKGLHFTATVSLILMSLTFLLGSISLLGLMVSMHPGIVIFMSILLILMTPLCFGFGVASFIIGLKDKRPAVWIIGLIAVVFALISFCFGVIYLIAGIVAAA